MHGPNKASMRLMVMRQPGVANAVAFQEAIQPKKLLPVLGAHIARFVSKDLHQCVESHKLPAEVCDLEQPQHTPFCTGASFHTGAKSQPCYSASSCPKLSSSMDGCPERPTQHEHVRVQLRCTVTLAHEGRAHLLQSLVEDPY